METEVKNSVRRRVYDELFLSWVAVLHSVYSLRKEGGVAVECVHK